MSRFANILETVGNTPVVKIGKLAPPGVDLFVKIEAFNPLGSVKDRLALGVIEDAERTGMVGWRRPQGPVVACRGSVGQPGVSGVYAGRSYPTSPETIEP
jgi:cysteine synthase A